MGVHINALDNHDSDIVNAFKQYVPICFAFIEKIFNLIIFNSVSMCYNINMRVFHPVKRNNSFYKFYPDYKDYCKTLKILQDFTYEVS